jgi:type I restriction enzyme S subunit
MGAAKGIHLPALRFPEFSEPWQEKRGRELFGSSRLRGKDGLPIYSVTLTNGLVPRNSLDRQFGGDADPETHLRAKPGNLVYNMMRMWQGAVGRADVECMVSPAYVVLAPTKDVNSKYFAYHLQRARSLYDLWAYSYGLTDDRLRLYYRDFGQIRFHLPKLAEQKKISAVLATVEEKIKALRRQRELLQTYKRDMMLKIFSQELRFRADDGAEFPEWEEKRLGEIASFSKGQGVAKNDVVSSGLPCIRYGELYTTYSEVINKVTSFVASGITDCVIGQVNDVLIPSSGETSIDISTASCLNVANVAIGGDVNIIRGNFNGVFLAYYLKNFKRFNIARLAQGISVVHLYGSQLKSLKLEVPQIDEQQKIADFLSAIDAKIDAVAAQIEKMEQFKKGLLQQMFV